MRSKKKYRTAYKKKVDVETDMYLGRRAPRGTIDCPGCGSVYYRRRWTLTPSPAIRGRADLRNVLRSALCPACRKIRDRYPAGELRMSRPATEQKREIIRILKNEEARAREKNPLERIMTIEANGLGGWKIHTTTEKLAQRLGRSLRKARGGTIDYKWSHNNKFVHVVWQKGIANISQKTEA